MGHTANLQSQIITHYELRIKSSSFRPFPFLVLIHKVVSFFYENVHSVVFGRNGFVNANAAANFVRLAR